MKIQQNRRINHYFFIFFCVFCQIYCLLSCRTLFKKEPVLPHNLSSYQEGVFHGSLIVHHQKERKNHLKISVAVSKDGRLRMDLTALLDFPVATFLLGKSDNTVLFFTSNEYYKGRRFQAVIAKYFNGRIDLTILKDILFDRVPSEKHWKCHSDGENRPINCRQENSYILWERKLKRLIDFREIPHLRVVFHLEGFSSKVEEDMFILDIPENFIPIHLSE